MREYLGSAAFSKAVQCLDLHTGESVCIKIIKNNKDFFDQSLDEIKLLRYGTRLGPSGRRTARLSNHLLTRSSSRYRRYIKRHDELDAHNVLHMHDFFYHKEHLFIVCELLRDNLYEFSKFNREEASEPYFTLPRLRRISRQCLAALRYIHSLNLIHCDLKPENILIKSYSRCEVKVIDFGSVSYTHLTLPTICSV